MLSIFISVSSFADADSDHLEKCEKMAKAFKTYDLKVKDSFIKNNNKTCSADKLKGSLKGKLTDLKDYIQSMPDDELCQSLSDVDLALTKVQNEFEVIQGFEKLRVDIKSNLEKTKSIKKKENQIFHATSFVEGLKVARDLELILNKGNQTSEFLDAIKTISGDLTTENVRDKLKDKCGSQSDKQVCISVDSLDLSQPTLDALKKLKDTAFTPDSLANWINALSIKKMKQSTDAQGNETTPEQPYSFQEIYMSLQRKLDLNNDNKDNLKFNINLTAEEIQAIKDLPEFEEGQVFDFREMKLDAERIELFYDYNEHLTDLKKRQELELTHKFVQLTENIKQNHPEAASKIFETLFTHDKCKVSPLTNPDALKECIKSLEASKIPDVNDGLQKYLKESIKSMQISNDYIENIEKTQMNCFVGTRDTTSTTDISKVQESLIKEEIPECARELLQGDLTKKKIELGNKIKVLEALKMEIIENNKQDIEIRDFAHINFQQQCFWENNNPMKSEVKCQSEASKLSPSVEFLQISMGEVGHFVKNQVFTNSDEHNSVCQKLDDFQMKGDICYIKPEATEEPETRRREEVTPETDPSNLTVAAPDGGYRSPSQDAMAAGLGNMMGTLANSLFAPKPNYTYFPPTSPYGYLSPYGYGYPMMSYSDQLLYGARTYGGYGYYMPTPGLRPYSSLGPASTSLYFSSP
jgi:hypothetical protein